MKLPGWEIIDEGVTPEAAIAWWKQRAKLTDAEARALTEGARQRAFYVTGPGATGERRHPGRA